MEPADIHRLRAAEGWLELGCCAEAREECESISPERRAHPEVLRVRCAIHGAAREWELCLEVAALWVAGEPDNPNGWIQRSYALHELKRTHEAFRLLREAVLHFPQCQTIPYNLACYTCQLGDRPEAWKWLAQALALGGSDELKSQALEDLDLQPIWSEIRDL